MRYLAIGFGALLAVLFITFFALMASRADGLPAGHGDCNGGDVGIEGIDKDENKVVFNAGDDLIDGVCIKSGVKMWEGDHSPFIANDGVIFSTDGEQKCYRVEGIGTTQVTVTRLGEGSACQGISHIDILSTKTSPPKPTNTPTPTPKRDHTLYPPPPAPEATPTPTLTPVATSAFQAPAAFPDTGGEPAEDGSNYVDTLKTVGILLVFIGLSVLAFWALFRRG